MVRRAERVAGTSPVQSPDARLEGARVAARGIAHTLNNDLTQALGRISLVTIRADLAPAARADLLQAEAALWRLAQHLEQFQRLERLVTRDTPDGPLLELAPSIQREPPGS
jgi:trans-aconitate methyltransferase